MAKSKYNLHGSSDLGMVRQNNEDTLIFTSIWDKDTVLLAAIDGVGGNDGGEVAAKIACVEIQRYLEEFSSGERLTLLKQAVTHANNAIFEQRKENPGISKMSCVLTSCIIDLKNLKLHMVHIGDTRLYHLSNKKLTKLSHDHSLIGYREEIGELTEDEAMNHPQRNIIGRDLGSEKHEVDDDDFLEAESFNIREGDSFLLCTDGLTDLVKVIEIESVLLSKEPTSKKVKQLISIANKKGGHDNITIVLLETIDNSKGHKSLPNDPLQNKDMDALESPQSIERSISLTEEPVANFNTKKWTKLLNVFLPIFSLVCGVLIGWLIFNFFNKKNETKPNVNAVDLEAWKVSQRTITIDSLSMIEYKLNNSTVKIKNPKLDFERLLIQNQIIDIDSIINIEYYLNDSLHILEKPKFQFETIIQSDSNIIFVLKNN